MQVNPSGDSLTKWFEELIPKIRTLYDGKKPEFRFTTDFSSPLQVEIFWQKDPTLQLFVFTHDADRPDLEITIHGPYKFGSTNEIVKILDTERYGKKFEHFRKSESLANIIAREWFDASKRYVEISDEGSAMNLYNEHALMWPQTIFGDSNSISISYGNLSDFSQEKFVTGIKGMIESKPVIDSESDFDVETGRTKKAIKCFGTHIFPPVNIGDVEEPSVKQIIRGLKQTPKQIINKKFGDVQFLVDNDGLIAVAYEDKIEAMKVLNAIMGMLIIKDQKVHAVRENDLYTIDLDKDDQHIVGMGYRLSFSLRANLISERHKIDARSTERNTLSPDEIKDAIEKITKLSDIHIIEDLVFLSEAFTALEESTLPQSFVLSWLIVERFLYRKWNNWWNDKLAEKQKIPNLPTDRVLQFLKSSGKISELDYGMYGILRDIRNNFVHGGHPIEIDAVKKCFEIAKSIVKEEIAVPKKLAKM